VTELQRVRIVERVLVYALRSPNAKPVLSAGDVLLELRDGLFAPIDCYNLTEIARLIVRELEGSHVL
jgi:hypothetical protein